MKFELMELPYDQDALAPFIGPKTVAIHHEKHHGGYVKKLDAALANDQRREQSLADIVQGSEGGVFNLAAQIWNHDFYWQSLTPDAATLSDGVFLQQVLADFGSKEAMFDRFSAAAAGEFGSGWSWLVYCPKNLRAADDKALQICSTTDAVNPMTQGKVPLLTLDVWEHAYYLDYQNERPRYIKTFLESHANWAFAADNYAAVAD